MSDNASIELRSLPLSARFAPAWRTAALAVVLGPAALLVADAAGAANVRALALDVRSSLAPAAAALPDAAWLGVALAVTAALVVVASAYTIARTDATPFGAERAAWLVALSPLLFAAITAPATAVGIAAAWGSLAAAVRRRFGVAGLVAALATVAVPGGWLAWFGVVAEYVRLRGWRASDIGARAASLMVAPVALALVAWRADGAATTSARIVEHALGVARVPADGSIAAALRAGDAPDLFAAVVLIALLASLAGGRRWPVARLVSVAAIALAIVAPHDSARLAVALAPAPVLWLGSVIDRRRSLDAPLLVLAALGLALFALA